MHSHLMHRQRISGQARREGSKFDLSVDAGACVLKLGASSDLGFCPAQKKVGARDAPAKIGLALPQA